ncbi:MAG: hypothetical protein KJ906_02710 [Nanoarchaeota archaeon]|nr:hypothetical protein [Nanoarchaeota archaeon]
METTNGITKNQSIVLFIISISTALIAVLVPIFTYREAINLNSYKIEEIKQNRGEAWTIQFEVDKNQNKLLKELNDLSIEMKTQILK